MFIWLNMQGVQSDRGFIVQIMSRFEIAYREGPNSMTIPIELGALGEKSCVIVDPHAFRYWDGGLGNATLPLEKQREILSNLREALRFQNVEVLVEAPEY